MVALMSSQKSLSPCPPRFATKRTPGRPTRGGEIAAIAEALGLPFMPWQRLAADIIGEYDPLTGLPTWRTVPLLLPRQSGKTTLMLAVILHRALMWGRPQRIAYTAQTGIDAKNKMKKDWFGVLKSSPLASALDKTWEGVAETAILFKGGSRVDAVNTSEKSGHGMVIDLAIVDEAFADDDFRREQALRPAMATRPDAQLIIISTAGTDKSVYLKQLVENGRSAAIEGSRSMAYLEWSAPDGANPRDPNALLLCNPSIGYTQTLETLMSDIEALDNESEVRRAYLNQWTKADDRIIPEHVWRAQVADDVVPQIPVVLSVDVRPDRSSGAVAAADADGRVEVGDHRAGVGWIPDRVVELSQRLNAPVVIDAYGPAGNLADVLEGRGVSVVRYGANQLAQACGTFYDLVADHRLSVRRHEGLDVAVAGARRRTLGDAWAWARKDELTDISPLVAATLAVHHARKPPEDPDTGLVSYLLE